MAFAVVRVFAYLPAMFICAPAASSYRVPVIWWRLRFCGTQFHCTLVNIWCRKRGEDLYVRIGGRSDTRDTRSELSAPDFL
jgi:hypothetical protein